MKPQDVRAPKEKLELLAIIEDGTQTKKGYSTAFVTWNGKKAIAIRWDGEQETDKGFPVTANGYHASWFILPNDLSEAYSKDYLEKESSLSRLEKFLKD
ncbi:hypothetical protein D920_02502 [Enterococcus faecalis 13-SD-W-01]|nr:hypothetical protein D920_02502 [Enterococcus faecalis 13-SD-W-01]